MEIEKKKLKYSAAERYAVSQHFLKEGMVTPDDLSQEAIDRMMETGLASSIVMGMRFRALFKAVGDVLIEPMKRVMQTVSNVLEGFKTK